MRRLFRRLLPAAAAVCLLWVSALAAGSAQMVRAFVYDGTLYTYVELTDVDGPITQAQAKVGGQTFTAAQTLETVQQAGFPVTYLLLVDNSTSMPDFREELAAFGDALARSGGENTRYLLTTFGDAFVLAEEDVAGEELADALEGLPFDENVTRLHSCLDQALDYFETLPRSGSELRCMVVLSDAVQYDPEGGTPYEELLERLSASDVMLHSVGVGEDTDALQSMGRLAEASGGTHQAVGDAAQAEAAAETLSALNGAMLVTGFDLSGCTASGADQPVSVTFASGGELVCRAESTVDLPEGETEPSAPSASVSLPPSGSSGSSGPAAAPAAEPEEETGVSPALWVAGVAAVVVIAVLAVLLALRRKKTPTPAAPQEQDQGIYVKVEPVSGGPENGRSEFTLVHELVVGRDPACDIVLGDPSVSRRHARIFLADGAVYAEDLGSQNGTMVNGSLIHMPCRLRSGDALTTGEVVWKLKF